MAYQNIEFPKRIAMGAQRQSDWATFVNKTFGGYSNRNINRSSAYHAWDISMAIRTAADYETVVDHFHQMRGQAHTFPFKDRLDNTVTTSEGVLTLVSGNVYQMYKVYGSTNPFSRKITRPTSGTVKVYRTRSGVTTLISPTIDYNTGRVTVSSHVAGDTYTWSGDFVVPCRYATDSLPGAIIDRQHQSGDYWVQTESIIIEEEPE